eukprot:COSAG01_NODE_71067_length_257_cov_0.594937_1_plen_33_part_01
MFWLCGSDWRSDVCSAELCRLTFDIVKLLELGF